MINLFKSILGLSPKQKSEDDTPGRTFKRILTGDYFGLRNPVATPDMIKKAKQDKIDKIKELGVKPMFLRYARKKKPGSDEETISAAHVVFQKEEYDDKLHMIHVTEISFIVSRDEFEEFEQMAGVKLKEDFKDLYEVEKAYDGEERRTKPRSSLLEDLEEV